MMGGFTDKRNFASKTTFRRLRNISDIYFSYQLSRLTRTPSIYGLPVSISIEPTTSCNLRCPECPSGLRSFTRPTGMIDVKLFRSIIDQLSPTLSYLTFYFQGEPYLHPEFLNMVSYASARKIYTATSTNAHYLKPETAETTVRSGLDRLIISIDGMSQETYESYRVGGSLEKVINGTRNIVAWKKKLRSSTPHLIFQFLVVKPNEHEVADVYRLAASLGVDQVVLKTAQIYDFENGSPLMPIQEKYSRYRKNADGTFSIKNAMRDECWKMWHSCVITWDGKAVPCCFDKDASHVLGDLTKESFSDIWHGTRYNEFRKGLFRARSEIGICKNCTEGTKVWA
jgi:radical SAM protein with 4Fe4S-binding SPASM domain